MSDYNMYNFTLTENNLLPVLRDAVKHGCKPLVIINGMYYNVDIMSDSSAEKAVEE